MNDGRPDEAALELMKQLITLSAGVLALSATFIDKLPKAPSYMLTVLVLSWLALVFSLYCGLKTISAIVKSRLDGNQDWSKGDGKIYALCCEYGFVSGIVIFVLFAFVSKISK